MRRPELVIARGVNSSEAEVSSGSSSSSVPRFRFFFAMCPRRPAAVFPALLPLGRPPRLIVLLPRGRPPLFFIMGVTGVPGLLSSGLAMPPPRDDMPALLPLGLPPLFLPLMGILSVLTPAAAAISAVILSSPSILTFGLLPPLPLLPPVLIPPLFTFIVDGGVGAATMS